uniref:Uncharacterized protein n=1 Tax=Sinocyclocheilus anshuiensis TaxID=1608454 RepID=A0A671SNJ7_9TELE
LKLLKTLIKKIILYDRLLQAVEQNDPEKVATLLVKKGLCPSKLDSEGKSGLMLSILLLRMDSQIV